MPFMLSIYSELSEGSSPPGVQRPMQRGCGKRLEEEGRWFKGRWIPFFNNVSPPSTSPTFSLLRADFFPVCLSRMSIYFWPSTKREAEVKRLRSLKNLFSSLFTLSTLSSFLFLLFFLRAWGRGAFKLRFKT